ncbi:2-oxoisovalerate dehydrogenase subunit beta [compost metagenome]
MAAIIAEHCLFELDAPIFRLCGPDVPAMPISPPMEKFFMLSKEKVKAEMLRLAQY